MNFYLVRHGEAVSDTLDPRRPLSRIGQEQVEQVARAAAEAQQIAKKLLDRVGIPDKAAAYP
ncbi:MAG: hypothetical protein HYY82_16305, partial [Deltaproteobacteria bacterium]|nr:hypothetical protein [Deltaproteobacteria bacterium]